MKRSIVLLISMFIIAGAGCGQRTPDASDFRTEQTQPASSETDLQMDESFADNPSEDETDIVTVPVTELIVTAEDGIPDVQKLKEMKSLRLLDLTALPNTPFETIIEIRRALPEECLILWNQKLTDGVFRVDATELSLPNATDEDVKLLESFTNLGFVDFTGSSEYEALFDFDISHPEIDVRYAFQSGELLLTNSDETVSVPAGTDADALIGAVRYFPRLKSVDLRSAGWSEAQMDSFCSIYPEISVGRAVKIGDAEYDSDSESLNLNGLTGWSADALIEKLRAFPNLSAIGLPSDWNDTDASALSDAFPNIRIAGKFVMFGREIDGAAETIDLSGTPISDPAEIEKLLASMPFVKKIDLCNCELSDEQMISLIDAHPDVRFIWIVTIGPHKLRTDAIGFSTKNPSKYTNPNASDKYNESVKSTIRLKEGDIEALKYCTDLEALDLGHNYLTNDDIAVISGLTNLRILILADNKITDISALRTLKNLEYIELFMNKIPDLSPLADLTGLIDVNVCNVGTSDLTPLFSLTNAKRLWYSMNPTSREQEKALKEALPDCKCNYTARTATGDGWREDSRYRWMRSYFD